MNNFIEHFKRMNKAVKASFWFVVCGFMQRGISVLTTPIFSRLMDSEQYGVFNVFSSWLEIITVIVTLRIYNGIYAKGLVTYEEDRDTFSSSLIGLTSTLVSIYFAIYIIFRSWVNKFTGLSTGMMLCIFALMMTDLWFNFWAVRKRVDFDYKPLVVVTIMASVIKPLFGIIAVVFEPTNKAYARIVSLVIAEIVVYTGLLLSQIKKSKIFYNKEYWKIALSFNIVLLPHYLSQRVLNHSDRLMISTFCGNSAAGIYSLAYNIASIMVLFNTAFLNTLTPWNYQQLKKGNYQSMAKIANLLVMIIGFINICLILIAPEALIFFAPTSYHEALYVIPPVAMGGFFMFLYGIFVNVEMYYSKNRYVMIASVTGALVNIILNYIFIPMFGYVAAAYTTLVSYIIYCLLHAVFYMKVKKSQNISCEIFNLKMMVGISGVFLILSFLLMLTYELPLLRYGIVVIVVIMMIIQRNNIIKLIKGFLELKR